MSMTTELIDRLRGKAKALRESGFNFDGLATDLGLAARVIENISEKIRASQMEQKSVDGLIEKLKEKSYSESEYGVDEFDASKVIQLSDAIEIIKDYCGEESEDA